MSIEQMKIAIAEVYPYKKWSDKVDNMSDNQVIGVYRSFLKSGKLGPKCVKEPNPMQIHIYDMSNYDMDGEAIRKENALDQLKTKIADLDQEKLKKAFDNFGIHFCKGCSVLVDEGETYCDSCKDIIEAFGDMETAMTEGLKDGGDEN